MKAMISIIIVNWNGKDLLPACLDSLRQQIYQPLHITLVDNGSTDGSVDFVVKYYPEVKIVSLPINLGFSAANNIALRNVETEYVALINGDAVAHPSWLMTLVKALETHAEAGCAASKMLFSHSPGTIDRAGDSYTRAGAASLRGRGMPATDFSHKEWVFGACAGAALYRSTMFDEIGLFDEDFFLLYEDVDLSFRAQLQGYKCIYVPEAVVYHRASSSIVYDSPTSVYYAHRNLEWVYTKNMPAKLILKTICPHLLYNIAAFFYFAAAGRITEYTKAKWDAFSGLRKVLQERCRIQNDRKVDDQYVWSLFERERFVPRLTRRMRAN